MKVNIDKFSGEVIVSFTTIEEEEKVIDEIFKSFKEEEDRVITKQWFNFSEKEDFYNFLADLWVVKLYALTDKDENYNENIRDHDVLMRKFTNTSDQLSKIGLVILQSMMNEKVAKRFKINQKAYSKRLKFVYEILNKNIDYNFFFDKSIKLPFLES